MSDAPDECEEVHKELEKLGTLRDTEPETLEVLGRLHAVEVERFYDRRRIEWRLAFTLWASFVAAGVLVINNIPDEISRTDANFIIYPLAGLFVVIAALHWGFEYKSIVPGSERGRNIGYAFSTLQRRAIGLNEACPDHTYRRFWAHYWLPTVTTMLIIVVIAATIMRTVSSIG